LPRGRWKRVCDGVDEEECWKQLLDHRAMGAAQVEKLVLPDGRTPGKKAWRKDEN
jgi:hypothetical protein